MTTAKDEGNGNDNARRTIAQQIMSNRPATTRLDLTVAKRVDMMNEDPSPTSRPSGPSRPGRIGAYRPGFTLVELLVVLMIMALTMLIVFPVISALKRLSEGSAGRNALTVGVQAARAHAIAVRPGFDDVDPVSLGDQIGTYSGVAILFTPAGELRLVENIANARDTSLAEPYLELQTPDEFDGFADIKNRDYIELPANVLYFGLARDDDGAPKLLAPPFAVLFDQNGSLTYKDSQTDAGYIYYDGDYDGEFETAISRLLPNSAVYPGPAEYDPRYADPRDALGSSLQKDVNTLRYPLPFEKIETVMAVVTVSRRDFNEAASQGPVVASPLPVSPALGAVHPATAAYVLNSYPITGVNTGTSELSIQYDQEVAIQNANALIIEGSTGNDGRYTIQTAEYVSGPDTIIKVRGTLPSATVDGVIRLVPTPSTTMFFSRSSGTITRRVGEDDE